MELPVINFEASINSLNNPSLISRLFSIFELGKFSPAHRLWKWGAVFLALVYAISSLVNKIKILFLHYHNKSRSLLSDSLLHPLNDDFQTDDDENDDVCSTSDSSTSDDEEDEEEPEDLSKFDDDFNVKGSFRNLSKNSKQNCKFRSIVDNFSLSDIVNGNGVVKLWDELGLGVFDVDNSFSFLDFNNMKNSNLLSTSIFAGFPSVSISPSVFISGDKLGLDIWDLRTGPAFHSDRTGNIVGVDAGRTGKVYVMDDVISRMTVCDLRKADTPLTEYEVYESD